LGSHLAAALLKKGYRIFLLARARNNLSAQERVHRLLNWLDVTPEEKVRLRVVEGDLNEADLGLDPDVYEKLTSTVDEIVHCASDTSLSERKRRQVEKANVENLDRLLSFASQSDCYFLHLTSTAYVAGKRRGTCPEIFIETEKFNNVYEQTKYRAEKLAMKRCKTAGISLNIYRPSVVYGHSRTGKTLRFNAVYYPVRTLLFFRNLYEKDIRDRRAKGAQEMGVTLDRQGFVHLPIRIESAATGGINLIPVDYFTTVFMAIMEEATDGGIFHIVNARTKSITVLIDYTQRFFRIKGVKAVRPDAFLTIPRNGLEILFNRHNQVYGPYMTDERIFDNRKTADILGKRNVICPDFDYTLFSMCMRFAVTSEWGSRLFGSKS
jgi:nucleoside-diphosphate-sugar epimerase